MCGPAAAAALVGAGLSAGSTVLGNNAANASAKAAARVAKREKGRQDALSKESNSIFSRALAEAQKPQQDARLAEDVAARDKIYAGAVSAPTSDYLPGQSSSPDVVKGETARSLGAANAQGLATAGARARLDGFSDLQQDNTIRTGRNMDYLSMLNGFRQGSLDVLPLELQAAQQKGRKRRLFADLLRAGGQIASGAAGGLGTSFGSSVPLNSAGYRMTGAGPMASGAI